MHHEPSGSCLALQPAADQRCPACQAIEPLDRFPAGLPAGCCTSCRRRSAAVARRLGFTEAERVRTPGGPAAPGETGVCVIWRLHTQVTSMNDGLAVIT